MRIGCLQFAPEVGDINNNLNRADAVLNRASPDTDSLDLLVLPELAFSGEFHDLTLSSPQDQNPYIGYNFHSLQHITPYLEPTAAGITSLWARTAALKYNCYVTAGYPEKVDVSPKWPSGPEYYNSTVTVNPDGETIVNYRKSFLYYTDETWALEGPGFYGGAIKDLGTVAMGICMDLKFEASWTAWEFANHIIRVKANLVVVSMAWLTREDAGIYSQHPSEPDMDTLAYWLSRFEPIIRAEANGEIIVVLANRCGVEDDAVYAGTSCVLGINKGEVRVYGILGRGEKELLIVDTSKPAQAKLVSEPKHEADTTILGSETTTTSQTTAYTSSDEDDFPVVYEEDLVSPVSPMNPSSHSGFFSTRKDSQEALDSLKSTIPPSDNPLPDCPPIPNSNIDRQIENEIGHQPSVLAGFVPEAGLENNRLDAIRSHPSTSVSPPDQSELSFTKNSLGPRSQHTSPRPTSTIW